MMYFKAIASAAAGFLLARLLVAVAAAVMGGGVGFEFVAAQAVLWVIMAMAVSYAWTQLEARRASAPAAPESEALTFAQV